MLIRRVGSVTALWLASLLTGCYYYNGETYSSQEAAFAAQQRWQDGVIAKIPRLPAPLAATVRVGVPSHEVIRLRGFRSPPDSKFVVDVTGRELDFVARTIRARGIFGQVLPVTTGGEHLVPAPDAAVVYFYAESWDTGGWYFSKQAGTRVPLFFDKGQADYTARVMYFLGAIEKQLAPER